MPKLLGLFFARTCLEQDTSRKETLSFAECPRGSTRNFDAWESEFYRIPMESSPECKACVFGKKLIFKSMMVSLIKTLFKGSRSLFWWIFILEMKVIFFFFISFFGCVTWQVDFVPWLLSIITHFVPCQHLCYHEILHNIKNEEQLHSQIYLLHLRQVVLIRW